VPTRVYIVRAITNKGRPGTPSARVTVPLVTPPSPPTALATTYTEQAVTVSWLPPVAEGPATPHMSFNVYAMPTKAGAATVASIPAADGAEAAGAAPAPLNEKPLDSASFEHSRVNWGVEQCFVARTVQIIAGTMVEGEPSAPACVTPRDTFPPAAPKGLSAVAGPGAINLIWDANTEADLAGYVVLRGEAPGDTLQPLNAEPTRETRYRDATVTPGVRYVYAIAAVDRAGNKSAASARVEETAQ
jgi:hypothetical protein